MLMSCKLMKILSKFQQGFIAIIYFDTYLQNDKKYNNQIVEIWEILRAIAYEYVPKRPW